MNAVLKHNAQRGQDLLTLRVEPLATRHLDEVLRVEQSAYECPWSHLNFSDALVVGYETQLLFAGPHLLGYFIAMKGVDEVHLLNVTVAPPHQRMGWGRWLLDALAQCSRGLGARCVWLEVRASNHRAIALYQSLGYRRVGERKNYYPSLTGQREDAVVMRFDL